MRRIPFYATVFAILALAGCGSDSGSGSAQGAQPANPVGAGNGNQQQQQNGSTCVVGKWRSDGYSITIPHATASGGAGTVLTIAPDGKSDVDFTGMSPVDMNIALSEQIKADSHMRFDGKISGKLKLPAAGVSTGTWESEPGVDWGDLRITVEMFGAKLFDNVPVKSIAGNAQAQNTNTEPFLGGGKFTCAGDKLTIEQSVGAASGTWTLHREH